jgi:hypothetical protein
MGCEIPHFVGGREVTLAQAVDWLRINGHARGWRKTALDRALEVAASGCMCVAVPKDTKKKLIAVVRPGDEDGELRVAAGVPERGNNLSVEEALGTTEIEIFSHD